MTSPTAEQQEDIATFMSNLYGMDIASTDVKPDDLKTVAACAAYVDGNNQARGFIECDIECASILGAALTQIPQRLANECIASNSLTDNLKDNIHEVFNISVNVFPHHAVNRFVLSNVTYGDEAQPIEASDTEVTTCKLNVPRYGEGHIRVTFVKSTGAA